MSSFSTTVLVKLMLMGLLSFALLLTVSGYYAGTRYGKRLPYESAGRVNLRSSSPRTIQSRSQVRFYAGSRYGGKRSYWETSMPESESSVVPSSEIIQQLQQQRAGNNYPYDCLYIPFVGVRCLPRRPENPWISTGDSDEDSGSPSMMSGNPASSSSPSGGSD